jgi:molecular chaperone DnaK (HSP70)
MKDKTMNAKAVGIDLGTTYSAVAVTDETGRPVIVPNSFGKSTTPSVVYFGEDPQPPVVGEEAKSMLAFHEGIASFFKREMGSSSFLFEANGRGYSPTDLSAIVLSALKRDSEASLGTTVQKAVITVPAYFNDRQRNATIKAGEQAELEVLRIINEPTAAALAFGLNKVTSEQTILVYDLGGGTFDVTIAQIGAGNIDVIATSGDHILGGKDWDDRIINWVSGKFQNEFGYDPLEDDIFSGQMRNSCEEAKKSLSTRQKTAIRAACKGDAAIYELNRETFEELTVDLLDRTQTLCEGVLREVNMDWRRLDGVLLVGGSTRMSQISKFIESITGRKPLTGVNVDEAVALGAAIKAAEFDDRPQFRIGPSKLVTIHDVMSHSLGTVAVNEDRSAYVNSIMIPKNTPIPSGNTKSFILHAEEQEVYVLQGESAKPWECNILGKYVFSGPSLRRGSQSIVNVTYAYDENGVVQVSATVKDGGPLVLRVEPVPEDMSWLREAPQEAQSAALRNVTVYLVIDLSGSMDGEPIKEASKAAISFAERLDLQRFSVGILTFADSVNELLRPSRNLWEIKHHLKTLPKLVYGGTSGDSFRKILSLYNGDERCFVVVLTDGEWEHQGRAIKDAEKCKARGIEIIAMGFSNADYEFLKRIATSDENALFTDLGKLKASFSKIAQEFNTSSDIRVTVDGSSQNRGLWSMFKKS